MSVELERALDRIDTAVLGAIESAPTPTLDEMGAKPSDSSEPPEPRNGLMYIIPEIENGDQRSDDTWPGRL